jgi:hypothetical protein
MPIRKLIVFLLLCAALGIGCSYAVVRFAGLKGPGKEMAELRAKVEANEVAQAAVVASPVAAPIAAAPVVANMAYPEPGVWITGISRFKTKVVLHMSDGSEVTGDNPTLGWVYPTFAMIGKRRVPLMAAAEKTQGQPVLEAKSSSKILGDPVSAEAVSQPSGYEEEQAKRHAEVERISQRGLIPTVTR